MVTDAKMDVICETLDGSRADAVIEASKASCMVALSLRQGFPVEIRSG